MSDFEREDLESILGAVKLRPSSRTRERLMYQCGRSVAMARSNSSRHLAWFRAAALVVAIGGGVAVGRWTAMDGRFADQQIVAGSQERFDIESAAMNPEQSVAPEVLGPSWGIDRHVSRSRLPTHAGMTLVRLESTLDQDLPHAENEVAGPSAPTPVVWSTGPFLNPLDNVEI